MSARAWIQAARPLAQANIAGPLVLGQGWAYALTGRFSWSALALVALFGVVDQLFIVFANDYADREHDSDARTPFSGGSGVLQDGSISPTAMRRAAIGMALGTFGVGLALARLSWWALPLSGSALLLVWMYSYPPVRLSFRGHGEWLQGLGVGAVLPLLGFAAQAGELSRFPFELLLGTVVLSAAGNIATSLPDHAVDRRAHKRSWAVRTGVARAAWACLGLTVVALYWLAWRGHALFHTGWIALAVVPLLPLLRRTPRTRGQIIAFVFLHGASLQLATLGWGLWLLSR